METSAAASRSVRSDWWWIFDPRCSLRARATLLCGGGVLVFTGLTIWIAGWMLSRRLEQQTTTIFETLAFQVSDKLDRAIYERYRDLQFTAGLAPLRSREAVAADRRQLLEAVQTAAPDFAWIGFANASGSVVTATERLFEGNAVEERPWFRAAREQSYVGPLHEIAQLADDSGGDSLPRRFMDLAVPVAGDTGQFVGVLAAHVRWGAWAREAQLSVVPDSARREHIDVTIYDPSGEVLLDSGGSGWNLPPEAPAIAMTRGIRGSMHENTSAGVEFLTGYARSRGYREFRGLGWLITVRQPVADALVPVRALRRALLQLGALVGLLVIVVAWIAAGRLSSRLRSITASARLIRAGDVLTVMPPPHGNSEIDEACGAVSDLVEDLRSRPDASAPVSSGTEPHLKSRPPATDQIHRMI
jgi:HAMP domain-containing protein